ncbi:hypothetical protein F4604DRAFT_1936057 [Suillus subluteus]|nr:hypothetical protein F4604DRAFT_1936057 [Suillus subluteus]
MARLAPSSTYDFYYVFSHSTYHAQLSREMRHRRDTFPHNTQYSPARAFSRLSALHRAASKSIHPLSNQSLGNYRQLVNFLESVEQLAQPLGFTDKEIIKYALKYMRVEQRQLLSHYEGDNYVEFADYVLDFYPECGVSHYTCPIFEKPAAIEAPFASAPLHQECTQEQPEAEAIAPISKVCNATLIPVVPEAPLDITAPPSAQLEACIISTPQESTSAPEYLSTEVIAPKLEVCEPITVPILPEAPLEGIIPPLVSNDFKHLSAVSDDFKHLPLVRDDSKHLLHISAPIPEPSEVPEAQYAPLSDQVKSLVTPFVADDSALVAFSAHIRDDSKHLSHLNAPVPEPSAAPEVQNAPLSDQVKSLVTPSITDHSALFAFSAYSDYRLPVKHPCTALLIRQLEHVSDDSDAPPAHHHTPEVAQVTHVEALSQMPFAFISPSSPQHFIVNLSFTRRIRALRALFPALCASTIAEEFSCYCVFTVSFVLNHTFVIRDQLQFNPMFMRDLCARLAYIHAPSALIIVLDFAFFTFIHISRSSIYHVDIVLACPIKGYLFMSWRQLALDLESIRCIRALSAPNTAYHSSCVNIFTVYQPLLTYSKDIENNAPKRECVRSSCAHYLIIERPHAPYIAPIGRTFNLYRKVQEFIPPVTRKDVEELEDEETTALSRLSRLSPSPHALFDLQHRAPSDRQRRPGMHW